MTDEELIERLRAVCTCNIDSTPCMAEDDCRDALAAALTQKEPTDGE